MVRHKDAVHPAYPHLHAVFQECRSAHVVEPRKVQVSIVSKSRAWRLIKRRTPSRTNFPARSACKRRTRCSPIASATRYQLRAPSFRCSGLQTNLVIRSIVPDDHSSPRLDIKRPRTGQTLVVTVQLRTHQDVGPLKKDGAVSARLARATRVWIQYSPCNIDRPLWRSALPPKLLIRDLKA